MQVTNRAGRPSFGGRRTTCNLPGKKTLAQIKLRLAGEAKVSLRSRTLHERTNSHSLSLQRVALRSKHGSSIQARKKTARLQESGSAKIVVSSAKA
jgi:hypothetical protein